MHTKMGFYSASFLIKLMGFFPFDIISLTASVIKNNLKNVLTTYFSYHNM